MKKTPFEKTALFNVNIKISENEYTAIAGHTGSGKSTLIQIMSGLIKPTLGNVCIDEIELCSGDKKSVHNARLKVGIVFQYPETQLFEETVEKDISFGPKNLGLDEMEIQNRVKNSMKTVGLPYDELKDMSPLKLSGGQQRLVAIAGVLAMSPKYLILDEPTAGLDPHARKELMQKIKSLHDNQHLTPVLITHNMDDITKYAQRMVVLSQGKILIDDVPRKVFNAVDILKNAGLALPSAARLLRELRSKGLNISSNAIDVDECEKIIKEFINT